MHFGKKVLLLSYFSMATVSCVMLTPALPFITAAFHLSHGSVEWVVSIFLLGYVLGQLIYAPLANRYGCLNAMRWGCVLNILGLLWCVLACFSLSFSGLLIGRFLTALGSASGLCCTFMLLKKLLGEQELKKTIAYATVSFTVGLGVSIWLGSIITAFGNWQDCFWLLLIHAVLILLSTYWFSESHQRGQPVAIKKMVGGYANALKNRQLILFSLLLGLVSVFSYGYSAVAPIYAKQVLHMSASGYGSWNLLNMAGMLGSGLFSAFIMERWGVKRLLVTGSLATAFTLVILLAFSAGLKTNAALFFATTALMYFSSGLLFPAASFLATLNAKNQAEASSMMSFVNMGSAMLGVIFIGYMPFPALVSFTVLLIIFYGLSVPLALLKIRTL